MAKIRVFVLGSVEHNVIPSEKAVNQFADQLRAWDGESDLSIVTAGPVGILEVDEVDFGAFSAFEKNVRVCGAGVVESKTEVA